MKTNRTVLVMVETALLTSLALILDWIANIASLRLFPNGGSISIAMLPVFVLAFRRGLIAALVSGLLLGTLQIVLGVTYYMYFLQFLFDYTVAFGLIGLAGIFYRMVQHQNTKIQYWGISLGTFIGSLFRYLSHVFAGVIYWGRVIGETNNVDFSLPITKANLIFSFTYNGSYMLPCFIICLVILLIINKTARKIYAVTDI